MVTPAVWTLAPPGTIIRKVIAADVPTIRLPSTAANERSVSTTGSHASISSSLAVELNAVSVARIQSTRSSSVMVLTSMSLARGD